MKHQNIMKETYLFDLWDYDIRKGVLTRIKKYCKLSVERDKVSDKRIANISIKQLIKN
jgi:hypothetical protein